MCRLKSNSTFLYNFFNQELYNFIENILYDFLHVQSEAANSPKVWLASSSNSHEVETFPEWFESIRRSVFLRRINRNLEYHPWVIFRRYIHCRVVPRSKRFIIVFTTSTRWFSGMLYNTNRIGIENSVTAVLYFLIL